jgi:predicted MPP superfamily phosphohydrolase
MGRRPFLRLACGGALTALSAGVLGPAYALMVEPAWLDIARCTVELPALPPALDGLTVAQLSDMHVTSPADANHLGRAVEVVQRLAPDLVALTGDYVTHDATHVALCAQALAPLQAPLGVYAVLGNHDVWTDADHVATGLAEVGITVLRDAAVPLDAAGARLWIVGVDDVGRTNRPGARCNAFAGVWERALARGSALLDELPPDEARLLLVHNPDVHEVLAAQRVDLALSGHTHGGQVRLPLLGAPVLPSCYGQKYAQGLVQAPRWPVYVNRGLGTVSPPVRLNCRPEVTLLTLRSAGAA